MNRQMFAFVVMVTMFSLGCVPSVDLGDQPVVVFERLDGYEAEAPNDQQLYLRTDQTQYAADDPVLLTVYNPLDQVVLLPSSSFGLSVERRLSDGSWQTYSLPMGSLTLILELEPNSALRFRIPPSTFIPGQYRLSVQGLLETDPRVPVTAQVEIIVGQALSMDALGIGLDRRSYFPGEPIVFSVWNRSSETVLFSGSSLGLQVQYWAEEQWIPYPLDLAELTVIVALEPGERKEVGLPQGLSRSGVYRASFTGSGYPSPEEAVTRHRPTGSTRVYVQPVNEGK